MQGQRDTNPKQGQRCKQLQCNGWHLRFQAFAGKPLIPRFQLYISKILQAYILTIWPCPQNLNNKQGQTNRNLFQEHETPSHISNSASRKLSKTTNSHHNSQGRPTIPREVEMAEATSSKRYSNGEQS
jgi:hypothetical protein